MTVFGQAVVMLKISTATAFEGLSEIDSVSFEKYGYVNILGKADRADYFKRV